MLRETNGTTSKATRALQIAEMRVVPVVRDWRFDNKRPCLVR